VLARAHRDEPPDHSGVGIHGPGGRRAQRRDRAALVAGRLQRELGRGQLQLVDTDERPKLRPRDLPVAGNQGEEERAVAALDDERFHDVCRRDAEQRRGLLERVRPHPFDEFDLQPAGRRVGRDPLPSTLRHASIVRP